MEQENFNKSESHEKEPSERAVDFLYDTIGMEPGKVEDFPEKLFEEVEKLERYQDVMDQVKDLPKEELPLAGFHLMRKSADQSQEGKEGNGVLLDSIKDGNLECAGRTMIASQIFRDLNFEHTVAKPYGHSMVLFEQDEDTLVYFDANNDLYFTFPKEALTNYQGLDQMAECRLKDYQPREKDTYEGKNAAMRHMMIMPPESGVLEAYLNNAAAALDGKPEFENDNIPVDKEAADNLLDLKDQLLGENRTPESFYKAAEKEQKEQEEKNQQTRQKAIELYRESSSREEFIDGVVKMENLWEQFPYLKGEQDKKEIAGKWYKKLEAM